MEGFFNKIDAYFHSKKESESLLMLFFAGILVAFLIHTYAFPPAKAFLQAQKHSLGEINSRIAQEEAYLTSITVNGNERYHIEKLDNASKEASIRLERTTHTNAYVDGKLKELSYLLFNDKNWTEFLDRLSALAQQHDVHLHTITNDFKEPSLQKIEQVLNVSLDIKGEFNNILKFINAIEESRLVVEIYAISLAHNKRLEGELKIAVWGMKY
jgi:ABC-type multidrug transport system fused ATPase/permease subunit